MADQELDQLDEVKATGENSMANDPVTPAGGDPKKKNRPADMSKAADPKADEIEDDVKTPQGTAADSKSPAEGPGTGKKAPARMADKKASMKESIEEMFAGQDLSEDFKDRATVIFEAAVNVKLNEEVARLEEEFETKLNEQAEIAVNDLVEKVDSYLDYVVEKWMEENELAVEAGIRTEMAESFMSGLYGLFVEHNVDLPEEKADIFAEMAEELEAKDNELSEAMNETIALRKELAEAHKHDAFEEISEGLTETQIEKLEKLAEGVDFDTIDDYKTKVSIIKENYFGGKTLTESVDEVDPIEEETTEQRYVDPAVASYADAISRTLRK
jgi:hypothetical protein